MSPMTLRKSSLENRRCSSAPFGRDASALVALEKKGREPSCQGRLRWPEMRALSSLFVSPPESYVAFLTRYGSLTLLRRPNVDASLPGFWIGNKTSTGARRTRRR
jgi:hypothetical protein